MLFQNLFIRCPKTGRIRGFALRAWPGWALLVVGFASTVWYLVRVLPKPSRAAYPCQRAGVSIRLGFLAYLAALIASAISFRNVKRLAKDRRFLRAALLLPLSCLPLIIAFDNNVQALPNAVNAPIGVAKGIYPGRVAWVYAPGAAKWAGTGNYWAASVNPQAEYTKAFIAGVMNLSGGTSDSAAWDKIFKWFNGAHGRAGTGYQAGDSIAIKINQNNAAASAADVGNTANANPQSAVACVASLVQAGVPQGEITIGDPSRAVTDNIFNAIHSAYPNVRVVDYFGNGGRVTTTNKTGAFPFGAVDKVPNFESSCFYNARYIINMPLMKGHSGQVITFGAKNFYGITGLYPDWTKQAGHPGTVSLTNFITSANFGKKVVLWCMDAMYPDSLLDHTPQTGWKESPFNGKPMSSFIMSLDGVAEESVSCDFFGNHYGTGTGGQDYIGYAADSGVGVQEHWNNATAKQYSRNLDSVNGKGIQLVYINTSISAVRRAAAPAGKAGFKITGVSNGAVRFTLSQSAAYRLMAVNMRGAVISEISQGRGVAGSNVVSVTTHSLPSGAYALRLESMGKHAVKELLLAK